MEKPVSEWFKVAEKKINTLKILLIDARSSEKPALKFGIKRLEDQWSDYKKRGVETVDLKHFPNHIPDL